MNPCQFHNPEEPGLARDLDRRFDYHAPTNPSVRESHEYVRAMVKEFAAELLRVLPPSRELSVAMTNLETTSFWAHAAIARNHDVFPPG